MITTNSEEPNHRKVKTFIIAVIAKDDSEAFLPTKERSKHSDHEAKT